LPDPDVLSCLPLFAILRAERGAPFLSTLIPESACRSFFFELLLHVEIKCFRPPLRGLPPPEALSYPWISPRISFPLLSPPINSFPGDDVSFFPLRTSLARSPLTSPNSALFFPRLSHCGIVSLPVVPNSRPARHNSFFPRSEYCENLLMVPSPLGHLFVVLCAFTSVF